MISRAAWIVVLSIALAPTLASADPTPAPPTTANLDDPPLFGDKDGLIYVRDPWDYVRLYPHARLALDAQTFLGPGVDDLPSRVAGVDLGTRFFVREARLALGGELIQRAGFDVALDLVANPAIDGSRIDGLETVVALSNAWVTLRAGRGLSLTLGYFEAPFSLENRSGKFDLPQLERNIAIRGFAAPATGKLVGASIGGSLHNAVLRWDFGIFGLESFAPDDFERSPQFVARITTRPFNGSSTLRGLQFGASGRIGSRNRRDAYGDLPAITSGQGFAMFRPAFRDGDDLVHIIPTDTQAAAGLELRWSLHQFVLRSEGYYVYRATEEVVEPERVTDVGLRGEMSGIGWYVELSWWVLQHFLPIEGELPRLGEYPHLQHIELAQLPPRVDRYGFELAIIAAGVNSTYDAAGRQKSVRDAPDARAVEIYQFGVTLNYWQTKRFRLSATYNQYWTPNSGGQGNLAVVPGNLGTMPDRWAHTFHELGSRVLVMF